MFHEVLKAKVEISKVSCWYKDACLTDKKYHKLVVNLRRFWKHISLSPKEKHDQLEMQEVDIMLCYKIYQMFAAKTGSS